MVSKLFSRLKPSATVEIQETLARLAAEGVDVIRLNAGEPDAGTPKHIVEAGVKALEEGKTRYTPAAGILPLREAIAEKLLKENDLSFKPNQIVVTVGAKQAIVSALQAILNPGDEVIIMTPTWVSYADMVQIAGGVPVFVPTGTEDFQPDPAAVEAAVTEKTKLLLVNSPNNPTGAVYPEATLRRLGEIAVANDLWILTDEIYEKLVYNDKQHVSIAALDPAFFERSLVVNGFSKSYAMTGWRAGYLAAPLEVTKAVTTLVSHVTSNVTTFVQWACLAALQGGNGCVNELQREFAKRNRLMTDALNRLPGVTCARSDGAFYLMPDVSFWIGKELGGKKIESSLDFANVLLSEAHVAVIPGEAFEAPGTVRVSYAASEATLNEGIRRIRELMER